MPRDHGQSNPLSFLVPSNLSLCTTNSFFSTTKSTSFLHRCLCIAAPRCWKKIWWLKIFFGPQLVQSRWKLEDPKYFWDLGSILAAEWKSGDQIYFWTFWTSIGSMRGMVVPPRELLPSGVLVFLAAADDGSQKHRTEIIVQQNIQKVEYSMKFNEVYWVTLDILDAFGVEASKRLGNLINWLKTFCKQGQH